MKNKKYLFLLLLICLCFSMFAADYSYVSSKVLILIYNDFQDGTDSASISDADVTNYIEPAVEFVREFYWRNSHMKVNLEICYATINQSLTYSKLAPANDPRPYALDPIWIRNDMLSQTPKYDPNKYASVIAIYALPSGKYTNYNGLTWPVLKKVGGECIFTCIPSLFLDSLRDIIVHEFNHAIDHLNEYNGFISYPSNHIQDYVNQGNDGAYNYFFDLNGGIIRDWPVEQWFIQPNYQWGEIRVTEDADNDGVPDFGIDGEGNLLAITEYSFLSSAATADSDGDNLSDLQEIMVHYYTSSDPNNKDTDKDGLEDGIDPYPLYPAKSIGEKKESVIIDGIVNPEEHNLVHHFFETTHMAASYIDWDKDYLYLTLEVQSAEGFFNGDSINIYLDKNADGIIQGNDNYVIKVGPLNSSLSINPWSLKPGEWTFMDKFIANHNILGAMNLTSNSLIVELAIPENSPLGIDLHRGSQFGLQMNYQDKGLDRQDLLTEKYGDEMEYFTIELKDSTPVSTAKLKVQYKANETNDQTNQIKALINLVNTGSEAIKLEDCKIRYYYSCEDPAEQEFHCDYIPYPYNNTMLTSSFNALDANQYYLEIGFSSSAGNLEAASSTGEIQTRFNKTNWTNYIQSNDYSFDSTITTLSDYSKITVYYNNELVWGIEP